MLGKLVMPCVLAVVSTCQVLAQEAKPMNPNPAVPPQTITLNWPDSDWQIAPDPRNKGRDEKWFELRRGSAALSEQWTVFELAEKTDSEPTGDQLLELPMTLTVGGAATKKHAFAVESGRLDLRVLPGWKSEGETAYVYIPFNVQEDGLHTFGIGADWWHKAWIDGEVISDTLATGNGKNPITMLDHLSAVQLRKGDHLLVVKFINGRGGAVLTVGGKVKTAMVPRRDPGVVWYFRSFQAPANPHVHVQFGAFDHQVWVNGQAVGEHEEGGKTPFTLDVTDAIRPGQENHVTVRARISMLTNPKRDLAISTRYLNLPVKLGGIGRIMKVLVDGQEERSFGIELADGVPDFWVPLNVSPWKGKTITLQVDHLLEDSTGLSSIEAGETLKNAEHLYREPLRQQFHFSSRRGWLGDPNGLCYFNGEYHLFYQHNPYGCGWGSQYWGHAVSKDLVHWKEFDDALAPDKFGQMWSGSAVVDAKNTSGLGKDGQQPMLLFYTAVGNDCVQCLAYTTDGRTFIKYDGNPILKRIAKSGNRDPKVIWHETSQKWIMALYVGRPPKPGEAKTPEIPTVHLLGSSDCKSWQELCQVDGLYQCPDFFELPVDGKSNQKKWVLTGASSEYFVGTFDGTTFTPESVKLPGPLGQGFHVAQTFSDMPDERRIQIGYLKHQTIGMPFNLAMSLPQELKLRTTPDGIRMTRTPVKELEALRAKTYKIGTLSLKEGNANPLAKIKGELLELRCEFEPGDAKSITFELRGARVVFQCKKAELTVAGYNAPAPLQQGRQRLAIYVDRATLEVFASDGLTYVPMPFIPKADSLGLELTVSGGTVKIISLEVYELESIWGG